MRRQKSLTTTGASVSWNRGQKSLAMTGAQSGTSSSILLLTVHRMLAVRGGLDLVDAEAVVEGDAGKGEDGQSGDGGGGRDGRHVGKRVRRGK